jgi:hypothetical protein
MASREFLQSDPYKVATPPAVRQSHEPGTYIGYDPLLVGRLRSEHQRILVLFAQTQALLTTRDYDGVKRRLGELRIAMQDHLMTANVRFYVYVSRYLAGDAAKSAIINEYRREMLVSSRQVMDFKIHNLAAANQHLTPVLINNCRFRRVARQVTRHINVKPHISRHQVILHGNTQLAEPALYAIVVTGGEQCLRLGKEYQYALVLGSQAPD